MSTLNNIIEKSSKTERLTKKSIGITPKEISQKKQHFNELQENILLQSKNFSKHNTIKNVKNISNLTTLSSDGGYTLSPVKGPTNPIYPISPTELLEPNIAKLTDIKQKNLFIFYFESLYPLTKSSKKWRKMSVEQLQNYYDNLQFWYIFNNSWSSSPMPVTLSDTVYKKWEKNTFYQANTVVQSAITSWGLAYRNNNGPQDNVKSSLTYTTKSGQQKTINSVTTDKEYWTDVACGNKIEVTSWGWNPYPFGIYAQGPFNGTGNFLDIPKNNVGGCIVGTSHWDIILKCKADNVTNSAVWTSIFNHELHDSGIKGQDPNANQFVYLGNDSNKINVTPWIIIHDMKSGSYNWSWLLGSYNGGYTPILIAYFLWYIGGFGGIGGKSPWDESWQNTGYKYTPIYVIKADGTLAFPEDQSVPANSGLLNFERTSDDFWNGFSKFFALIQSWDTDWNVEKWRHPVLNIDGYPAVGPSVANPSDSLMQAYVTGNFDIVKYSIWNPNAPTEIGSGLGEIDPNLSRFSKNPAKWSSYQTLDGTTYNYADKNGSGFPFGEMIDKGGGYNFVIRTQMPNVNFDICCEFADFRITTPGNLSNGTGDQRLWAELFTKYAEQYMFTADPDDTSISHSFKDQYSIRLPDITLQKSNPQINNWLIANNVASGKTFFDFDVKSGTWDPAPSLTGIQGKKSVSIPKNLGSIPSNNCTVQLYINYGHTCTNSIGNSLEPKAYNNDITNITGTAVTDSKFVTNNNCGAAPPYPGYTVTNAPAGSQYFPSAVDDFSKGIVGYQANGYTASLGSCQTRWIISSNGIPWDFSAPLSNRLLLLKGSEILDKDKDNDVLKIGLNILLISFIIISTILGLIYILKKNSLNENSKKWLVKCLIISAIITTIIIIFKIINYFQSNRKESLPENVVNSEDHRLRTYFALVYPMVPVSRWNKMSLDELRIFFCSLHWWYKGKGLPSPEDYLGTDYWNNTVPFGKNSSWKTFCLRKNCVKNVGIPAYNETDNKLVVGHNDIVPTSKDDTPSAIIWTGRQLQSLGAQSQQTTFFHPSYNYHIDTYNNFPTVNDTGLEYWQNAQYVEVSSQWGPFPDGIYYDWAPGTGVWLSLEKHAVGYTGLDLIRRMGNEFMDKKLDLSPLYKEAWQKTGLSTMVLDKNNKLTLPTIFWPDYYGGFGYYGTVILTNNQSTQINTLANSTNPKSYWTGVDNYTADGDFFKKIAKYVKPQYLVETNGTWTWTKTMPSDSHSYVENYPLPLPYFKDFQNDGHGNPKTNPLALRMPWEYQLFNVCQMMRVFCIDLLFLDESLIDSSKLEGMEYVDWLKANQKSPLNQPRTWKEAIDALNKVIATPYAHPVLLRYPRIFNETSGLGGDGPSFILENETNTELNTVQTGALNTNKYIQTVSKNKGATYSSGFGYPQLAAANLEIDHWLPMLGRPMDYKSCVRIQHWCGNKSLSLDIEIINISQQISGNLISNMPTQNLYEVWKKGAEERLSVRDPFANDSHVYFEDGPIHNIRQKYLPSSSNSQSAKWTAPPWIYYYPNQDMSKNISNIYGWPCENLNNFMTSNRLSYCPVNSQQVALSGSYPEYNEILFETFVRNKNILL